MATEPPLHTVILYSRPGCPHCDAARAALASSGHTFEERNPLESPARLKELMLLAAVAAVPTISVSGRVLVGFDADRLEEMLREPPPDPEPPDDYTLEEPPVDPDEGVTE